MTLTIDIGNTSAKYGIFQRGKLIHYERIQGSWVTVMSHVVANFGTPRKVVISNVGGPQPMLEAALEAAGLKAKWLTYETEEAQRFFKFIPQGLGCDRLAADVAARTMAPAQDVLVVDSGTCLTFDVIRHDGVIVGGSISPGVGIRLKAMHDYTEALPLFEPASKMPVVGTDIATAMIGGCLNGVRWEIEGYIRHLLAHGYPDLRVFFNRLDQKMPHDVETRITRDPALVCRGLYQIYA